MLKLIEAYKHDVGNVLGMYRTFYKNFRQEQIINIHGVSCPHLGYIIIHFMKQTGKLFPNALHDSFKFLDPH